LVGLRHCGKQLVGTRCYTCLQAAATAADASSKQMQPVRQEVL
jgi:hypothetical protein